MLTTFIKNTRDTQLYLNKLNEHLQLYHLQLYCEQGLSKIIKQSKILQKIHLFSSALPMFENSFTCLFVCVRSCYRGHLKGFYIKYIKFIEKSIAKCSQTLSYHTYKHTFIFLTYAHSNEGMPNAHTHLNIF